MWFITDPGGNQNTWQNLAVNTLIDKLKLFPSHLQKHIVVILGNIYRRQCIQKYIYITSLLHCNNNLLLSGVPDNFCLTFGASQGKAEH